MNDLNNLTNLNNNYHNNNNNNNDNNNNNNNNNKNIGKKPSNVPADSKNDTNLENLNNKILCKESNENLDEEETTQLSITLSVRASKFEAMYPIWIEKNREVEFKVIGKWSIDSTFPMCDCNGYIIKNKKDLYHPITCNNNNNNISNITTSTNYNPQSTNDTNININSICKNANSNNLVLLNSPTAATNEAENKQEAIIIKESENNKFEVDKKALLNNADSDSDNNANLNIESAKIVQSTSGYIGASTTALINNTNTNNINNRNDIEYSSENKIERANINLNSKIENLNNDNNNINTIEANSKNQNDKNNLSLNCLLESFPNGCLIGRVLGGSYFRISSNCSFISEYSGPLFLKMNIHDLRLNPEGKISVFINGAEDLPFMSIEKKLGWDINSLSLGCQLLKTESERLIYTFINKIRINSNLFAQQYLENIKTLSNTTNGLYVCLHDNKTKFKLLNMDAKLIEYGRRLVKREIERLYNLSITLLN